MLLPISFGLLSDLDFQLTFKHSANSRPFFLILLKDVIVVSRFNDRVLTLSRRVYYRLIEITFAALIVFVLIIR
jgi:hypothetical protein